MAHATSDGSGMRSALEAVLSLDGDLSVAPVLERELGKLREGVVNVVVVGQFKRGKSTLLNAVLGEPVLPMGVTPVTAIVTVVRPGPARRAVVRFLDGRSETIPVEELAGYVSERRNPENRLGVERVEVELTLRDGRVLPVLADTPGSGSVFRHNTEVLRRWLGRIDAGLFVVSADPPVGEEDLALLGEVQEMAGEVLVVLNKVDRLAPEELQESIAYTRMAVDPVTGRRSEVIPCSARRALEGGLEGTGVDRVAAWLEELAQERGGRVLEMAVARRAGRALARELAVVEVEANAARRSAEELERALGAVGELKEELERRLADTEAAFDAGCRRLLAAYDDMVRERHGELADSLAEEVRRAASELEAAGRSGWSFQRRLEAARDRAALQILEPVQAEQEQRLVEGFESLTSRALDQVNALVDEAFERAAELLGVTVERFDVREDFSMESRLEYRVGLPKVNLDYLMDGLLLLLPPPVARKAFLRRQLRMLPEAVGRQLGLIRADLHERLNESAISFRGNLRRRVAEALPRLEEAIRRGLELVRSGREQAAERLVRLDERRAVLERAVEACVAVVGRTGGEAGVSGTGEGAAQ